jgi:hypothetical protein
MSSLATERVVVSGPAQLVTLVPFRLGFHPADSLVLLEVKAAVPGSTRNRLGVVLRVDLPPTDTPEDVRTAVTPALEALAVGAAPDSRVLVLGYDPEASRGGAVVPGPRAAATLEAVPRLLAETGREVFDVLVVTEGRFRSLTCDGPCCPSAGTPLGTATADRLSAEAVGLGFAAAPDRDAALPPTSPVDAFRRALASAARQRGVRPWTPDRRRALLAEWDEELDRRVSGPAPLPDAERCGRLLAAFDDVATRDAVLLGGARGPVTDRARAVLVGDPETSSLGEDVHDLLARALAEETDGPRSALAAALAVDVARHATGRPAAGAWAVAAWSSWNAGDGLRARAAAEEALRQHPGQSLAGLVLQLLLAGRGPRQD